jgi:hypothetical protein
MGRVGGVILIHWQMLHYPMITCLMSMECDMLRELGIKGSLCDHESYFTTKKGRCLGLVIHHSATLNMQTPNSLAHPTHHHMYVCMYVYLCMNVCVDVW